MSGEPGAKDAPPASTEEELGPWVQDPQVLAWAGEHLPELQRSVSEHRYLRWSLVIGFLVILAAKILPGPLRLKGGRLWVLIALSAVVSTLAIVGATRGML